MSTPLIRETLCKLAKERLTAKQKIVLTHHCKGESLTRLVKKISENHNCSETAVWNNIRGLKRAGLLEGRELTDHGQLIRWMIKNNW